MTLDVSVQDPVLVHGLEGHGYLAENIEDLLLLKESILVAVLQILFAFLNLHIQVTSICVFHYDAQLAFPCLVHIVRLYDIGVRELFHYLGLFQRLLPLLLIHVFYVDLLDNAHQFTLRALAEVGCAEGAGPELVYFLVLFY